MKRSRGRQYDEDDYQPPVKKNRVKESLSLRTTRLMQLDAARRAVFGTVELLERILEQLPSREVIVCERVCRQVTTALTAEHVPATDFVPKFQEVINSSHKIQRKLFRKVADSSEEWTVRQTLTSRTGSLWSNGVEHHFELASASHGGVENGHDSYQVCNLNEAFFAVDKDIFGTGHGSHAAHVQSYGGTVVRLRPELEHILTNMTTGASGSWASMHITSPPCREVHACVRLRLTRTQVCRIDKHIVSSAGITLGELARQLSASTGGGEFGRGNSRRIFCTEHGSYVRVKECSGPQLSDFLAALGTKYGPGVTVDREISSWFKVQHVVLPSHEEIEEVRGRGK